METPGGAGAGPRVFWGALGSAAPRDPGQRPFVPRLGLQSWPPFPALSWVFLGRNGAAVAPDTLPSLPDPPNSGAGLAAGCWRKPHCGPSAPRSQPGFRSKRERPLFALTQAASSAHQAPDLGGLPC